MKSVIRAVTLAATLCVCAPAAAQDEVRAKSELDSARQLYAAGNWETAKEAYGKAFDQSPPGSVLHAEAALELASLHWEQGAYVDAEKWARKALELARAQKLDHAVGRLMLTLGHIEAARGKLSDAEATLTVCASSAEKQFDQNFAALCRINLRFVRQLRGRSVVSEKAYKRDLDILKKTGEPVVMGTALAKAAELQEKRRDLEGALRTLLQAEKLFQAAGSRPAEVRHRLRMAQIYQNMGRWADSEKQLDGVVNELQNMRNRPSLVTAYALSGKQKNQQGDAKGASTDLRKALDLAKKINSPHLTANAHLALCEFWAGTTTVQNAAGHCASARDGFDKLGAPSLSARSVILLARLAQREQRWLDARTHYIAAIDILESKVAVSSRDPRELAVQHVNLCQVEMQLKSNGAHQRCRDALKSLEALGARDAGHSEMLAGTRYALGATTADSDPKAAAKHFEAAARGYKDIGRTALAADAYLRLGKLRATGSKKAAQRAEGAFREGLDMIGKTTDPTLRPLVVQLELQLVQARLDQENWEPAKSAISSLIEHANAARDPASAGWAYHALARVELKLKNRDAAITALKTGLPLAKKAGDKDLVAGIEASLAKLK